MSKESPKKPRDESDQHETRDVNPRAVAWFAAGLVIAVIIIFFALNGMFNHFNARPPAGEPSRITEPRVAVPEPQLQTNPTADMEQFRARENEILGSYGWVDHEAGVVRIPIERAMDLVERRGLHPDPNSFGKTPLQMRQARTNAP